MSTTHKITEDLELDEASCKVSFVLSYELDGCLYSNNELDAAGLRKAIIRQIEVLSYISDDPEEVLRRFNVNYGDQK